MRYDYYKLPILTAAQYIVDVQSDYLSHLPSRMVIPLISTERYKIPIKDLHPVFEIEGVPYTLLTHELASIQKKQLPRARASLLEYRDEITRAMDILFTGI